MNIHIRYEDNISNPENVFSLGVTLKELSITTTNQNWDKTFYDRMVQENKDKPIFKKLKIDGLAAYLQVGDNFFINEEKLMLNNEGTDQNVIMGEI